MVVLPTYSLKSITSHHFFNFFTQATAVLDFSLQGRNLLYAKKHAAGHMEVNYEFTMIVLEGFFRSMW